MCVRMISLWTLMQLACNARWLTPRHSQRGEWYFNKYCCIPFGYSVKFFTFTYLWTLPVRFLLIYVLECHAMNHIFSYSWMLIIFIGRTLLVSLTNLLTLIFFIISWRLGTSGVKTLQLCSYCCKKWFPTE